MTTPRHTPPTANHEAPPRPARVEPAPAASDEHAGACADCGHTAGAHDPGDGHCLAGAYTGARCDCLGFEPDAAAAGGVVDALTAHETTAYQDSEARA